MDMDVQQVLQACEDMKKIGSRLQILQDLGLGYLTLGEAGGRIIAKAIPEKIACDRGSITGKYLR
jgi:excinuclease UvrABC ATPase subunit